MKNIILIIPIVFWSLINLNAQAIDPAFFTQVDQLFKTHVKAGAIDYKAIEKDTTNRFIKQKAREARKRAMNVKK